MRCSRGDRSVCTEGECCGRFDTRARKTSEGARCVPSGRCGAGWTASFAVGAAVGLRFNPPRMSTAYQIVVCGSIVPDPLQTLEPLMGPAGPSLQNEAMLPATLDP